MADFINKQKSTPPTATYLLLIDDADHFLLIDDVDHMLLLQDETPGISWINRQKS